MRKKKTKALPQAIVSLAKEIVNQTGDGVVGYAQAADAVSENWNQFAEAGANVTVVEGIMGEMRGFLQILDHNLSRPHSPSHRRRHYSRFGNKKTAPM